ncbi:fibronectin type III domain-containing protein, partial [Arthrobacter bambusae]
MRLLTILFRRHPGRSSAGHPSAWHGRTPGIRNAWFRFATAASVLLLLGYTVVYSGTPARAAVPKTIISLTFDDGNADQLPAEQLLKSLGLHGTFFITTSWIDNPSWLTRANLNTIAADGNEIGGHTITHPDLTTLSTSAATNEVCGGRTTLASWGFNATDFAYPFAAENPSVEQIVKNCGFASARNLGDIRSPASCSGCPFAETLPPANPYNTAAPDEVDSTWTLQNLENLVTNAEPGGGWVQLTFHHIAVGTDPTLTIDPNLFKTFVTWLAGRTANGTTSVQTVAQALGNASTVTAPAAPAGVAATAGNASAVVSWTAPANGGSPITSYAVTPHAGAAALAPVTVTGNPPSTTATVTGLTNGTAYTFTVTATNAVGTSPASAASAPVTPAAPTAPSPPTGVAATAGNASAVVSWTAPANGGSPITSYAVTPSSGGTALAPVTVTGNPPSTTATVTGLTNGTAYTFTVTATNTVGTSPASAASAPVTPAAPVPGVTNGGFESGLTSWTTGGVRAPVASTVAHTGTGSALLGLASGAEPLGDSNLSQTITVPAAGTSTLSFWYQP